MRRLNSRLDVLERRLVGAPTEPMVVLLTFVHLGQDGARIATLQQSYIRKDGICLTLYRQQGESEDAFEARVHGQARA